MAEGRQPLERSTVVALGAMGVAVLVIANDFTALTVALPAIESDFGTDLTTAQWVINGYALVFGVLIVTGGRLADMFGRRTRLLDRRGDLRRLLGDRRLRAERRACCSARAVLMGDRRRDDVAGDPRHDLCAAARGRGPGSPAALILGAAGFGNAVGPLLGGSLTDALELALDLLPQPADRRLRDARHLARTSPETSRDAAERRIDYAGIATLSVGCSSLLARARRGHRTAAGPTRCILGLFAARRGAARRLRVRRAARRARRAGPERRDHATAPFAAACLACS